MTRSARTANTIIAAVKDDSHYRAVAIRGREGEIEILWARSQLAGEGSWATFAADCGLTGEKTVDRHTNRIVGLDSTAVAFYRLQAPAVGSEETAAIGPPIITGATS